MVGIVGRVGGAGADDTAVERDFPRAGDGRVEGVGDDRVAGELGEPRVPVGEDLIGGGRVGLGGRAEKDRRRGGYAVEFVNNSAHGSLRSKASARAWATVPRRE